MQKRGFTLVEMLTVVGIIATMAGTMFTMFGTSQGRAKVVRCATNLDQIGKSLMLYCADHDDNIPPFLNFADGKGMMDGPYAASPWRTSLELYTKSSLVFFCPEDPLALKARGPYDVSVVDHRQTSYANADWLKRHTIGDILNLNLGAVDDPSQSDYLRDDAVGTRTVGKYQEVPFTPHDGMPNVLYLDGHVHRQTTKTDSIN